MGLARLLAAGLLALLVGCQQGHAPPGASPDDGVIEQDDGSSRRGRHEAPTRGSLPAPEPPRGPVDGPKVSQPAARRPGPAGLIRPQALPAGSPVQVRLKLLLVTATADETGYAAMTTFLGQIGVPYDTLIASQAPLTSAMLESSPGLGNYNGVILTTNNLAYFDGTGWYSAFDAGEWELLRAYERDYGVREVSLFTYPDSAESGLVFAGVADTTSAALETRMTDAGRAVFDYLQPAAVVPIRYAYTYLAQPVDANTVPLLTTQNGETVAAVRTAPDGRELLSITAPHNPYLAHSLLLNYGVVRWVSRGVLLGERKLYFAAHVDDYFIEDDLWDVNLDRTGTEVYRASAADVGAFADWQARLRAAFPLLSGYTTDLAYNGTGYQQNAPVVCDGNYPAGADALSAITRCKAKAFRWINHTFSHVYIDDTNTLAGLTNEIRRNRTAITGAGGFLVLAPGERAADYYQANALVTGNHSGLGYLDEVTPPVNRGKSRANPNLVRAAQNLGIGYLASNTSAPTNTVPDPRTGAYCSSTAEDCSQNNPSPNTGQRFPPNLPANNILLTPRFPVNVFYNVTTPDELVDEYNYIYRSYWGRDLSYAEILDFETDVVMSHVMSYSVNPHYFHQSNIRAVNGGSLVGDFVDALATKYSRTFNLPLLNFSATELGRRLERRTAYNAAGASAIWTKSAGTSRTVVPRAGRVLVTTSTPSAAVVPLTNPSQGAEYGSDRVTTVRGGATVNVGQGR